MEGEKNSLPCAAKKTHGKVFSKIMMFDLFEERKG
jgi:hypothetical protein